MAAAMAWRMAAWRSDGPRSVAGAGARPAASTSSRVTTPCGPLPVSTAGSRRSSPARLRAAGETRGRLADATASAGLPSTGATGSTSGLRGTWRRAVSALSPACSKLAIGVPTGTLAPGSISNSKTSPSCQHSTSTAALAVSTTAITWPRLTVSPGLIRHSSSVPSSMSAPRDGSLKSIMHASTAIHVGCAVRTASPMTQAKRRHDYRQQGLGVPLVPTAPPLLQTFTGWLAAQLMGRRDYRRHLWQRGLFQGSGVGDRHLGAAHPRRRRVPLVERLLDDPRDDLGGQAAAAPAFFDHQHAAGLAQRGEKGRVVQRTQHAQVDDLGGDALPGQLLGRRQGLAEGAAIGDQGQVAALAAHPRRADVHRLGLIQLAFEVVELGMLEDQHRIGGLQRRPEPAAGVLKGGRGEDLQAWDK